MTHELWSAEDELGFQMGDMHGEWQKEEAKTKVGNKKVEKPFTNTPTKPVKIDRKPECQKKHIRRNGK